MNQYYIVPTHPQAYSPPVAFQASSSPPVLVPNVFYPLYNMPPNSRPATHAQPQGFAVPAPQPQPPAFRQQQIPTHEAPPPTHNVPENTGPTFVLTMEEIKEESKKLRERGSAYQNGTIFFAAGGETPPLIPHQERRTVPPQPDSTTNAASQMFQNVVITQPTKL